MRNRRYLVLTIIIFIIASGILYVKDRQKVYGNDAVSIRMLIEKELEMTKGIEIIDTVDLGSYRITGYSVNGIQFNYATFRKNRKGDYEPVSLVKTTADRARQVFIGYHSQVEEGGITAVQYLVILSSNEELREIRFTGLPGQNPVVPSILVETSPSMHIEAFPTASRKGYGFYDASGNPIGD